MAKDKKLISRRNFLVVSGAAIVAGALTACTPKTTTETVTSTKTVTNTTTQTAQAQTTTITGAPVTTTKTVSGPETTITKTATQTATQTAPAQTTTVTAPAVTNTKIVNGKTNSWDVAPSPIPDSQIKTTISADVVIVGAGLAGTTAACRAAQLGAKVVVIEKMAKPSFRGGQYAAYQTRAMNKAGIKNEPMADILHEWIGKCGNRCNEKLVWNYLSRSSEVFQWFEDISEGKFTWTALSTHYAGKGSWYHENYGTHSATYTGDDNTDRLSAPLFVGNKYAKKNNAQFIFNTRAEQLIKNNNKVVGVVAKDADGYVKLNASKAVILATGDVAGDAEMVNYYCRDLTKFIKPENYAYTPVGGNTGDGHKMGLWAGGHMDLGPFPTMIHLNRFARYCFCYLFVNQLGKRFMNEDTDVQGRSIRIITQLDGYNEFAFSIFDDDWRTQIGPSLVYGGGQFWDDTIRAADTEWTPTQADQGITSGLGKTAWKADTLEELASLIGVDKDVFVSEVKRYNQMYEQGEDTDYHKRKEFLTPIKKAPFYATKFGPRMLVTCGGLEVDPTCRVVDDKQVAIPGLFAIGNVMGGRYGVDYPLTINGNSHGSAMTFGYIAAETAVK